MALYRNPSKPPATDKDMYRVRDILVFTNTPSPDKKLLVEMFEIYHKYFNNNPRTDTNCGDCINTVRDYLAHRIKEWQTV